MTTGHGGGGLQFQHSEGCSRTTALGLRSAGALQEEQTCLRSKYSALGPHSRPSCHHAHDTALLWMTTGEHCSLGRGGGALKKQTDGSGGKAFVIKRDDEFNPRTNMVEGEDSSELSLTFPHAHHSMCVPANPFSAHTKSINKSVI